MTIHLSCIQPGLGQLNNLYTRFKDTASARYLLSAVFSQELRHRSNRGETFPGLNRTLIDGTIEDYSELHGHTFDTLKVHLMSCLPELREVIYDFYFYKFANDTDAGLDDQLRYEFTVGRQAARSLEFFFLILAEESVHDEKFAEALIPEDLLHKNIDISEILYFMSEHFHELGKTKHHIRR